MTEDENYRRSAEAVYTGLKELQGFALKMQGECGRWLIVSLLSLHVAAIGGVLLKTSGGTPSILDSLWWFVAGIILALAAGFSAFWNFFLAASGFDRMADHRMLSDRQYWPTKPLGRWVKLTLWLSVSSGVLSAACLLGGAIVVRSALQ
jgi:hypothetical protein